MDQFSSRTHQSLQRGLRIIEAVAAHGGAATAGEIAEGTSLTRGTVRHLVHALVGLGYLLQEGDAQPYKLGPRLLRLTGRTWAPVQLADLARVDLDELSRRTGETTGLAILRHGVATIVAKRESDGPVRVVQELGAQRPIYCTALGKALAAWLRASELEEILPGLQFKRYTPKTLTSAAAFRRELARIRKSGVSIDNEEHNLGIRCIAAPVRDFTGDVCAAICVVSPAHRMTRKRLAELRPIVVAAAAGLSVKCQFMSKTVSR
jgi:DNA-binding IclR family transcriptional regulator